MNEANSKPATRDLATKNLASKTWTSSAGQASRPPSATASPDDMAELEKISDGRYRYLHDLGSGGTAKVVLARDTLLDRDVAVKFLCASEDQDGCETLTRFLREASVTAGLDHPGVVPVHDIGTVSGSRYFLVMKVVEGACLHDVRRQTMESKMSSMARMRHLCSLLVHVCEAVGYAHFRGIMHLDLKPSNIMVGEYGEVMVLDWGSAQRIQDRANEVVAPPLSGTPGYMSPEHREGEREEICPASDVYSLGAVLCELLTGKAPSDPVFQRTVEQPSLKRRAQFIRRQARANCGWRVPKELAAICAKALSLAKRDRYLVAREMAEDLQAYLEYGTVSAIRVGWVTRARKLTKRNSLANAAFLCLVTIAVILVGGFGVFYASNLEYRRAITAQVTDERLAYYRATCRTEWIERQKQEKGSGPEAEREAQRLKLIRFLAAQRLRNSLEAMLEVEGRRQSPQDLHEFRRIWMEEMVLAIDLGDKQYAARGFAVMQKQRGTLPRWAWQEDEFLRVEALRALLRASSAPDSES